MTSRIAVSGIIMPLILMGFCLLYFLLPEFIIFPFSFVQLLLIFAYVCIMSFLSKKKDLIKEFVCAYFVIAIPFILGFLYAITSTLQEIRHPFFSESMLLDNLSFCLFVGGFVSVVDVAGTVRLFYDGISGFDPLETLLYFVVTAILLVTPLIIYKLTKTPNNNIQESNYGSKID